MSKSVRVRLRLTVEQRLSRIIAKHVRRRLTVKRIRLRRTNQRVRARPADSPVTQSMTIVSRASSETIRSIGMRWSCVVCRIFK